MSDTILLLQLEHRHANRLLGLIEQQVELGPECDLEVLGDIADYFLGYPELCHHPVEDSVLRHLQARDPKAAAGLEQLFEDHEFIAEIAQSFAKLVKDARHDATRLGKRFAEEANYFVEHYRQHMYSEELEFFPLAERTLGPDDWAQIEFDLFDRQDPLYDEATESRFRALREKIEAELGPSMERAAALHRTRELHAVTDISSFNELMTETKRGYRLIARDKGGYSLQREDDTLIDIPACSEARAAWCAWYYLQSSSD
jgi:hemerythrin-like domain-containing protein